MTSSIVEAPTSDINPTGATADIHTDFKRDVYCLFGLPVDDLSLASTAKLFREIVDLKRKAVLSTVNANWIVTSLIKPDFRAAILNSDICTLDGRPLVFFSRILGLPMKETVAGSSLIEYLIQQQDSEHPFSIFLFGGDTGTAERACAAINSSACGLMAVGHDNPGFGPVAKMVGSSIIQKINDTFPDILLVALGAYKGSIWIESTRKKLNARIISHLGATINFLAGSVKRAPVFLQKIGLEWIWRISEEPSLFKRYLRDGLFLLRVISARLLIFFKRRKYSRIASQNCDRHPGFISAKETPDWITLKFSKQFTGKDRRYVQGMFSKTAVKQKHLILDFAHTEYVDSAFLAYMLILIKHQKRGGKEVKIVNIGRRLSEIFYLNFIFDSLRSFSIGYDHSRPSNEE